MWYMGCGWIKVYWEYDIFGYDVFYLLYGYLIMW